MTDCVIGTRIGKNGYARYPSGGRGVYLYAHRVAWEAERGPIPPGWQIHHRCETKACINVEHMQLMATMRDHKREHPAERKCDHDERYIDSRGKSVCRCCRRKQERERYHTDPAFRARKIARAAEFKRKRRGEVMSNGSR